MHDCGSDTVNANIFSEDRDSMSEQLEDPTEKCTVDDSSVEPGETSVISCDILMEYLIVTIKSLLVNIAF